MDLALGWMVLAEADIALQREHQHLALEDRTGLGEGAEGLDQAVLDPLQEIEDGGVCPLRHQTPRCRSG